MKALTLIQPWATLIVAGHKHFETRSWQTSYRGPVLIHAGKKVDRRWADWLMEKGYPSAPDLADLPTGAVVGVAEVVGMWSTNRFLPQGPEYDYGDYSPNRWAWQLANVVRLAEPVPCRGQLNLWEPPAEVLAEVRKQLAAA